MYVYIHGLPVRRAEHVVGKGACNSLSRGITPKPSLTQYTACPVCRGTSDGISCAHIAVLTCLSPPPPYSSHVCIHRSLDPTTISS